MSRARYNNPAAADKSEKRRRRIKRANIVLFVVAIVVAAVVIGFSAYFISMNGIRQSNEVEPEEDECMLVESK